MTRKDLARKIYRKAIEHLSNIYRTSLENIWKIYRESNENLSIICKILKKADFHYILAKKGPLFRNKIRFFVTRIGLARKIYRKSIEMHTSRIENRKFDTDHAPKIDNSIFRALRGVNRTFWTRFSGSRWLIPRFLIPNFRNVPNPKNFPWASGKYALIYILLFAGPLAQRRVRSSIIHNFKYFCKKN